jgi:hypothetical protein
MSTNIGDSNPQRSSAASTAAISCRVAVPQPQNPQENMVTGFMCPIMTDRWFELVGR